MANRKTCVWCRVGVQAEHFRFYSHSTLCPEHKRLRNRMQRKAPRG